MSRRTAVLLACVCIVLLPGSTVRAGELDSPPAPASVNIPAATNQFGFALLHTLTNGTGGNVIVSPLSVSLALALAGNGAGGETRSAIAKTLAIRSFTEEQINHGNRELLDSLEHADAAVQMEIANALWMQSGFAINPAFVKLGGDFYQAPAESLDFAGNPESSTDRINSWVNHKTHGKIPKIVEGLGRETRVVVTDAVYFKGKWAEPFDPKLTRPRTFHLGKGTSVETPMMAADGEYDYFENPEFQAVRLPYGNDSFAMYILLPRKVDGLGHLLSSINRPHWDEWTGNLSSREGKVVLPKFELTYEQQLNQALKTLGMGIAFDPGRADFSRIHTPPPQLYISEVEHKTYVKVDEAGTEAAAATAVAIAPAAAEVMRPVVPFYMVVDHPFLIAIAEQRSGAILFLGTIANPTRN